MNEREVPEGTIDALPETATGIPEKPAEKVKEPTKEPPKEIPKKLESEPKKIAAPVKPSKVSRLKEFIVECKRVLRVTRKPDRQEFKTIVKVSALGMGVIGIIGFIIHFVKELMF